MERSTSGETDPKRLSRLLRPGKESGRPGVASRFSMFWRSGRSPSDWRILLKILTTPKSSAHRWMLAGESRFVDQEPAARWYLLTPKVLWIGN